MCPVLYSLQEEEPVEYMTYTQVFCKLQNTVLFNSRLTFPASSFYFRENQKPRTEGEKKKEKLFKDDNRRQRFHLPVHITVI